MGKRQAGEPTDAKAAYSAALVSRVLRLALGAAARMEGRAAALVEGAVVEEEAVEGTGWAARGEAAAAGVRAA
jgi:hypothetical protein